MRVLMIDYYLPDSIYTLELGRELKKHCSLSVFCREDAGASEEGIRWFPCFYPGGKKKLQAVWAYGKTLCRLAWIIRTGKFDVVHVQCFKNMRCEAMIYRLVRRFCGKFVLTAHNVLPHEEGMRAVKEYRKLYAFCDEIIVHNQTSRAYLMEQMGVPEEKITVIAHGAYQTHMEQPRPAEPDGKTHFLQFGFIRKYKGIDILLKAVSLIPREERETLSFVIAGKQYEKLDDTDYPALIKELGVDDCVRFERGHVPDGQIAELFGRADFLVFPYRHIYGSGALLLSYTYRKPVIVSDIPAFLEETDQGKTGLVFESENPQALSRAIRKAARSSSETRKNYQEAVCRLVEEKYNWSLSAARTADVYRKWNRR